MLPAFRWACSAALSYHLMVFCRLYVPGSILGYKRCAPLSTQLDTVLCLLPLDALSWALQHSTLAAGEDPRAVGSACRGKRTQYNSTSLIQINGVASKEEVDFYLGKRLAYVYKAKTLKKGTKFRVMWGKVRTLLIKQQGSKGCSKQMFSALGCAVSTLPCSHYFMGASSVDVAAFCS